MDACPRNRENTEEEYEAYWIVCCKKLPKKEVIFFAQVILIYVVSISCVVNLSLQLGNQSLWSSLLSGCIGYILPSPKFSKKKYGALLSHASEQQLSRLLSG